MNPLELSHYLRQARDPDLRRRRAVVCLSLGAAATMGLIAAYQVGIIKHLPEPRIRGLDAEKINGSAAAYQKLQTPDALLGLGSYAVTAILAAAGGKDRGRSHPWLPVAAFGKTIFDAANALKLTRDEIVKHRAVCLSCLAATMMTLAMVPLALPEALSTLLYRSGAKATFHRARERVSRALPKIKYPWSERLFETTHA